MLHISRHFTRSSVAATATMKQTWTKNNNSPASRPFLPALAQVQAEGLTDVAPSLSPGTPVLVLCVTLQGTGPAGWRVGVARKHPLPSEPARGLGSPFGPSRGLPSSAGRRAQGTSVPSSPRVPRPRPAARPSIPPGLPSNPLSW